MAAEPGSFAFLILFDLFVEISSHIYSTAVLRASILKINTGRISNNKINILSGLTVKT